MSVIDTAMISFVNGVKFMNSNELPLISDSFIWHMVIPDVYVVELTVHS
jgi:hypothetical protein